MSPNETWDVVIVGSGPAGLSAALVLGRARKRVLLCDDGTPRNAPAHHMNGFVSRDGVPPREFRALAREQFEPYPITRREAWVTGIERVPEGFRVTLDGSETVEAARVLLSVGVVDELPPLPGLRELWGQAAFMCPYCHGWEIQDRAFGVLVASEPHLEYVLFLTGWSRDLVVFTSDAFPVSVEWQARLSRAGVRLEERRVARLVPTPDGHALEAVELADGSRVAREALFLAPPQRQTELVRSLGLALDELGYVKVDEKRETSLPGLYAAGDLTTKMQSAILAAGAGAQAAYALNHGLNLERAERR